MNNIITVFNAKAGVGCSLITWNYGLLCDMMIFEPKDGMLDYYADVRSHNYNSNSNSNSLVSKINKFKLESGIYDVGSDIKADYFKPLIKKSKVIIIPTLIGHETSLKTIMSIRLAHNLNPNAKIWVLVNKLQPNDSDREKKYTDFTIDTIKQSIDKFGIEINIEYIRYGFSFIKDEFNGAFFLDPYLKNEIKNLKTNLTHLRHLRYYYLEQNKKQDEHSQSTFYLNYDKSKINHILYDKIFNNQNAKPIKDMLIIATRIQRTFE